MRRMRNRGLLCLLVWLVGWLGGWAQPPASVAAPPVQDIPKNADGTYTIRVSSRVVVLDVVVTDKQGNVVTGLKKEDFHVTEADEPQTVRDFEAAGAHAVSPGVTVNSTAELDRLAPQAPVNIILLDEFNEKFEDEAFARYSLKKFLATQPDKLTTPTMLLAVDLSHFYVLKDYTQDKASIVSALDHHLAGNPFRNTSVSWSPDRFQTAFVTLMRVAEAVQGHPGHKNMIWIGRGFPTRATQARLDNDLRVETSVQACVNALRDARVTLYSVDPAGITFDQNRYGPEFLALDPFGGNYDFNRLARATGGRALYGQNDVDAQIATDVRDGETFYTLSYRPTNDSRDTSKFRKIKVTLTRPDLVATTREGYYLTRNPARVDPLSPSRRFQMDMAAAAMSTMVYDAVPVTAKLTGKPNEVSLHIDGKGVNWYAATDTEPRHAELIVFALEFDKKGKALGQKGETDHFNGHPEDPATGPMTRAVDVNFNLTPDPKAVRVRFVVRSAPTGRLGTADLDLGQSGRKP